MGLKYLRYGAVGVAAGLILSMAGAGAALAADPTADVVMDGVITVHHVDSADGPMAGATIQVSWYREGDEISGLLPAATLDAAGAAVVTGVPRPIEGAAPVLLDVRSDRTTATVDAAGCTHQESWLAESKAVPSGHAVDLVLETTLKSIEVSCPEPTPSPDAVDPAPTAKPTSGGAVLAATGRPQVTPPATDAVDGRSAPAGSPLVPVVLVLVALAAVLVPPGSLGLARAQSRRRDRR